MISFKKIYLRTVCVFTTIAFILYSTFNYASATTYNGINAAIYALHWYDDYNTTEYYEVQNGDCTNFVSQCLKAGGKSIVPHSYYNDLNAWAPHSATWEQAESFRKYWKNKMGINVYNVMIDYSNNNLNDYLYENYWSGDVMQYQTGGTSNHSQIVVGQATYNGYPTLKVAQHTGNTLWRLSEYFMVTNDTNIRAFRFHAQK